MQSDATHAAIVACPVLELQGHCCHCASWKTSHMATQCTLVPWARLFWFVVQRNKCGGWEELSVRLEFILCVCVCVFQMPPEIRSYCKTFQRYKTNSTSFQRSVKVSLHIQPCAQTMYRRKAAFSPLPCDLGTKLLTCTCNTLRMYIQLYPLSNYG